MGDIPDLDIHVRPVSTKPFVLTYTERLAHSTPFAALFPGPRAGESSVPGMTCVLLCNHTHFCEPYLRRLRDIETYWLVK